MPRILPLGAAVLWAAPLFPQPAPGYLDFAALERRIQDLARQHPQFARLEVIGRSAGGRAIYVLRIAAARAGDPDTRQGVFAGANIAGYHNAGSQAALALAERLLTSPGDLKPERTYYLAPALNPDAHDAMFTAPRTRRSANDGRIDRDRDGLEAEDGPEDLNNDGRITVMRIADAAGDMLPDPAEPRLMVRADPSKGQRGAWRVVTEGVDNDGDGEFNEDAPGGYRPDKNFAHGFAGNDPESGPWPSYVPETKAVMDFLLARRNIALAVVFGPANSLLAAPRAPETRPPRVRVPRQLATALELDTARLYTIDEVWEAAKDRPLARTVNRERLEQMLGGEPTRVDPEDLKYLARLGEGYRKTLEKAGLDARRPAAPSEAGGLANWLYFHYGVLAVELDVWGVSKRKTDAAKPDTAASRGSASAASPARVEPADILAYAGKEAPAAIVPWTPVSLADGTKAEVGGFDPFVDIAPPEKVLAQAAGAHAEAVLGFAEQLARLEIAGVEAREIGGGVWRVTATARNTGALPTHTRHGQRTRNYLPVRLRLTLPQGASLVSGRPWTVSERLDPAGSLKGEWLVRARKGARVEVAATSSNAGTDRREFVLEGGR